MRALEKITKLARFCKIWQISAYVVQGRHSTKNLTKISKIAFFFLAKLENGTIMMELYKTLQLR